MDITKLHDEQLEQKVLGSLMAARGSFQYDCLQLLSEDYFYSDTNREIFRAMQALQDSGEYVNLMFVHHRLQADKSGIGPDYLASLPAVDSDLELLPHCQLLREYNKRRKSALIASRLMQSAETGGESFAHDLLALRDELTDINTEGVNDDIMSMKDAMKELYEHVENLKNGVKQSGLATGFSELDQKGGFLFGDLVIVAAKSSVGKTSFALYLADHFAHGGNAGAIYSMEMNNLKLAARITSAHSGVNSNVMLARPLTDSELESVNRSLTELYDLPIYFDDKNRTSIDTIIASIRRLHARKNIRWAIVDYLQILSTTSKGSDSEAQKLAEYSRRLKSLANDLGIVIIALSQLRKDSEDKPRKDRIYGAAEIESASDTIIMLYRPILNERSAKVYDSPYENVDITTTCLIDIQKGRNCGIFNFMAGFDPDHTRFYPLTELPRATVTQAPPHWQDKDEDAPF